MLYIWIFSLLLFCKCIVSGIQSAMRLCMLGQAVCVCAEGLGTEQFPKECYLDFFWEGHISINF